MRLKLIKSKKLFTDITLNIVASGTIALVLQVIVYPLLNKHTSPDIFGEILIMMSVVNIVAVLLGSSLNNIRLIFNKEYEKENIKGDFSVILIISSVLNVMLMIAIISLLWSNKSTFGNVILIFVSVFTMLRSYLTVSYRLNLDYKKIFKHSTVYSFALLLSTVVLMFTDTWQFVFFIGELVSLIYLYKTTDIIFEPLKITYMFKNTFKQFFFLSVSNLIKNLLMYLDRIIIFTFLGTQQVAIFFAATVIGKMSSFVLSPISGVVLSYLSNLKRKMSLSEFWLINSMILAFSTVATFFTLFISKYILKVLYADLYLDTLNILLIANSAAILKASSSISQAIILKYNATYVQVIIQSVYGLVYIGLGIYMIKGSGLMGFSIATLIAAIVQFLIILGFGSITLKNKKSK